MRTGPIPSVRESLIQATFSAEKPFPFPKPNITKTPYANKVIHKQKVA
jgi:hypothetical protein